MKAREEELGSKLIEITAIAEERRQFILNGVELGYIHLHGFDGDPENLIYQRCLTNDSFAILDALRAEGVEMFAESQKAYVRDNRSSLDPMMRAAYCGSAVDAEKFARQLRESKGEVQS